MYYIDQKIRDYEQLIYNLINKTNASIVFFRICSYATDQEDEVQVQQETLAQDTTLSLRTVKRMISYLKEKRFIEINKKNGIYFYKIPITRDLINRMSIEQIKEYLYKKINDNKGDKQIDDSFKREVIKGQIGFLLEEHKQVLEPYFAKIREKKRILESKNIFFIKGTLDQQISNFCKKHKDYLEPYFAKIKRGEKQMDIISFLMKGEN